MPKTYKRSATITLQLFYAINGSKNTPKVIPWFCIAQPFLRIIWAPFCVSSLSPPRQFSIVRVISESMTTFHGILWENKPGNPRFFFQVFAKNSLINNIFEEEKKFDSRTWFFGENSSVPGVFWPRRGLKAIHEPFRKSAIFPPPANQKRLKWSNTAYVNKKALCLSSNQDLILYEGDSNF